MGSMRDDLIQASRLHFEAHIEKHRMNVENLLDNGVGVAEHGDIMDTIEKELSIISEYDDKLNTLKKYFPLYTTYKKNKEVING